MKRRLFIFFLFCLILTLILGMQQERKLGVIGKDSEGDFKGKKWAIIIGISRYKHLPAAALLKYADRDAELFYDFIKSPQGGGFSDNHIQKMLNHQASKKNIETALGDFLVRRTSSDDIIYIYFAGHGYVDENQRPYLIAYDTEPDKLFATALRVDDINQLIYRDIKARHIILITDACHSGYIGAAGTRSGIGQNLINRFMNEINRVKDSLFNLSASTSMELSHEDAKWGGGHGVFTYYLVKGLKGEADSNSDGLVNASEAFRYVLNKVSAATGDKQHPEAKGRYDSELTLAVISPKTTSAAAVKPPAPTEPEIRNEELEAKRKRLEKLEKAAEEAERRRAALEEAKRLGEKAFQAASKLNTAEGWKLFIQDYPNSPRITEARERLKALDMTASTSFNRPVITTLELQSYIDIRRKGTNIKKYDKAIANYTERIKNDPKNASAYFDRGLAHRRKGQYSRAIADYTKSIELRPTYAMAYNNRGYAYCFIGQYDRAIEDCTKAIELNPSDSNFYDSRSLAYWSKGLYDLAIADSTKAIKIGSNTNAVLFYYNRGNAYLKKGQYDLAIADYTKVIELNSELAPAYNNRGIAYQKMGLHDKAEADLKQYEKLKKIP